MAKSSIEWTDSTWNPATGCDKISPGCKHCYAETMARRLKAMGQPNYQQGFKLALHPAMLERPLAWRKPQVIFVNSMSDLFHKDVPLAFIQRVFDVMRRAEWHTFQVLTKRAERLEELAPSLPWPRNVWMGVSVEHEGYAFRIDHLRRTPAAVRFLSLEPLLGPLPGLDLRGIDWVIVGGESGPGARPMEQAWATDIRDQCRRAGIPFFFKQWGGRNKKAAGRLLGGRTWDELPATSAGHLAARPGPAGRGHRARRGSARPRGPRSKVRSAISEEARLVRTLTASPMTETPDGRRRRSALQDVWRASSVPDWDGYEAAPVTREALAAAEDFLGALPSTWPPPETAADPDGEISFEWARDPHWVFTVSVSPERRLSYAGLFGVNRVRGVESFLGQLPQAIVDNLVRFFRGSSHKAR